MLANRLTENENISVLLVEAGEQFGPLSTVPLLAVAMQKSKNDWSFQSVPQQYSSKGMHDQVLRFLMIINIFDFLSLLLVIILTFMPFLFLVSVIWFGYVGKTV